MNFYIFNNGLMSEDAMSGCDQHLLNYLPFFLKETASITVITSQQGKRRFKRFNNVRVVETTGYNLPGAFGLFISYLVRAIKGSLVQKSIYIDGSKKNIIYSASDLLPDLVPALFLKMKNREAYLVVGVHLLAPRPWKRFNMFSLTSIYYFLSQNIFMIFLKKFADFISVPNEYDRRYLIAKGFKEGKVLVTHGGIDDTIVESAVSDKKLYDACYVGRFHPQKGFTDLIPIWKKVVERFTQAKLIVIGDDANLELLKKKVQRAGLNNNITFLGFVGGIKKYTLIKQSKLAVMPSYYESLPLVILEAMACSVPVVAYRLPVYLDIYTQGIKMVDIGDKKKFADAVISLLENAEQRKEFGQAAKELSKKFRWEKSAGDILSCLR